MVGSKRIPEHPILPPAVSCAVVATSSRVEPPAGSKKRKAPDSIEGDLNDTWTLWSTTYNRWNASSTNPKYSVRYSREAIIADPPKLSELPNYHGATGKESKKLPNKHGKNSFLHV